MQISEAVKTNMFHVRDPDIFEDLISRVVCESGELELWTKLDDEGEFMFSFSAYGEIYGLPDADGDVDGDVSYDDFLIGLQECVSEDDAIIMIQTGFQGTEDVFGFATIITSEDTELVDLQDVATERAMAMLKRRDYD